MKIKAFAYGTFLISGLFFVLNTAFADGMLIAEPPRDVIIERPFPGPQPLPVKYHRVKIDINNGVATTSIDQVFKNDYDVDLEATYMFPIPEEAAIKEFVLYMNGKRVSGEVLDKDKARQIYEDIVRRMKDPGLLEYAGRNMFRARVYPVPKHGETRIEIVYQQTLNYDAGVYKYVYPLNTEKFSPKPLEEVTISAKVASKVPIKSIYSPSHEVDTKLEQFNASCGFEAKNVRPDKDFVMYYTVSEKDVGLNLLAYREKAGGEGYFLLLLSPGELDTRAIDKDIIFVLDTSGSMDGAKIDQAKQALRFCVNKLGEGDRFNIVSFASGVNTFRDALVDATKDNISSASDFVGKFQARGGTDINSALLTSLRMFGGSKRPRMVVFLTDGEPTVGTTNPNDILKNVADANGVKARIFIFGVGNDVNTHLLDKMAEVQRGVCEYVVPGENIEVKVSSFYSKISEPVLSDIKLDFGKIKVKDVYPVTLPDIFKGTQLVLFGRYEGDGATAITLTGNVNGSEKRMTFEDKFPAASTENDFIPRIWATRKIGYLMSEIRFKGENKELVDEIVKLSKEHGIMTPYTSFLVLENEKDYRSWGIRGVDADSVKLEGMAWKNSMAREVGASAVSSSANIYDMKEKKIAYRPALDTIKHIGDKTFYLKDNVWVDAKYAENLKTIEVKYLSGRYFELLRQNPRAAKYFAIAKNVIIVLDGECYKITE
ncbi:MAG: VIT domain-containing protein [Candidatus Omnitrophica bacterium]|nr:VIT domain-containing protein [Candidatus Omnitrophota bacterium]